MDNLVRQLFFYKNIAKIEITCIFSALIFGLYLEYFEGLSPCNLCLIQRYFFYSALICSLLLLFLKKFNAIIFFSNLIILLLGSITSLRQIWLQNNPNSNSFECGGLIGDDNQSFISNIYEAFMDSDQSCSEVLWTFLDLSIAGWAFLIFLFLISINLIVIKIKLSTTKII